MTNKEKIKILREALEFYAKPSAWGIDKPGAMTSIDPYDQEDYSHQEVGVTVRGGKRARQALKEVEGILK